jgi:hypothetical protein
MLSFRHHHRGGDSPIGISRPQPGRPAPASELERLDARFAELAATAVPRQWSAGQVGRRASSSMSAGISPPSRSEKTYLRVRRHAETPIVTGRLHDLELHEESTSRSAAGQWHATANASAVTRNWSALLELLVVNGLKRFGPEQVLHTGLESTRGITVPRCSDHRRAAGPRRKLLLSREAVRKRGGGTCERIDMGAPQRGHGRAIDRPGAPFTSTPERHDHAFHLGTAPR